MAKRTRNLTKKERKRSNQRKEDQELTRVVQDMASQYTCSVEVTRDFASVCNHRGDDLGFDLATMRLATEFWRGRPGAGERIVALLAELEAATQRHLELLDDLGTRFATLADEQIEHDHLEPVETYRTLVRERLFSENGSVTTRNTPSQQD